MLSQAILFCSHSNSCKRRIINPILWMGTLRPKRGSRLPEIENVELTRSSGGGRGGGIWRAVGLIPELSFLSVKLPPEVGLGGVGPCVIQVRVSSGFPNSGWDPAGVSLLQGH